MSGSRSYSRDSGFPVQIANGGTESITVARDSAGRMWTTSDTQASVQEFGGDANCPSEDAHIADDGGTLAQLRRDHHATLPVELADLAVVVHPVKELQP